TLFAARLPVRAPPVAARRALPAAAYPDIPAPIAARSSESDDPPVINEMNASVSIGASAAINNNTIPETSCIQSSPIAAIVRPVLTMTAAAGLEIIRATTNDAHRLNIALAASEARP